MANLGPYLARLNKLEQQELRRECAHVAGGLGLDPRDVWAEVTGMRERGLSPEIELQLLAVETGQSLETLQAQLEELTRGVIANADMPR